MGLSASESERRKRRKPWCRVRNIVLAIVAVLTLAIGYVVYESVALMNAEPNPVHDYWADYLAYLQESEGVNPVQAQQAWEVLSNVLADVAKRAGVVRQEIRSGERIERFSGDRNGLEFWHGLRGPEVSPLLDRERAFIESLDTDGYFDRLDRFVAPAPAVRLSHGETSFRSTFSDSTSTAYMTAGMLLMRARLALASGDRSEFIRSFASALASARSLALDGMMITYTWAASIYIDAIDLLDEAIVARVFNTEQYGILADVVQRFPLPSAEVTIQGGHFLILDSLQNDFSDDGQGDGYQLPGRYASITNDEVIARPTFVQAFQCRFLSLDRREIAAIEHTLNEHFRSEMVKRPIDRWRTFDPDEAASHYRDDPLLRLWDYGFMSLFIESLSVHTRLDGRVVLLRIEQFVARTGRHPSSLIEIERELDLKLPTDPLHGEPFVYRRLEEPDEYGRTYLLYSTGYDQTDDGGREATSDDHEEGRHAPLKDRSSTGFDFVINQPRKPRPDGSDKGEQ